MPKEKKPSPQSKPDRDRRMLRDYARYSNLAYKLIAVVLAAFFIGWQLDKWIKTGFPLFTLILSVAGLILTLYLLVKELK